MYYFYRILIYSVLDMSEVATISLPSDGSVVQIKQHCDSVFVALTNGILLLYRRGNQSNEPDTIVLGPPEPVSCILPINLSLYVACGKNVHRLNAIKGEIQVSKDENCLDSVWLGIDSAVQGTFSCVERI